MNSGCKVSSSNNKRIAKNSLFLYVRLLLMVAITLYTSRIVLDCLGEDDYGIYNVVGGVVAMFAFVKNSLIIATQRFLTFELGKGNKERLNKVFSTSVFIQILLAAIIFVLTETIGLWFLNTQMSIPEERLDAANFVLQCSILTCIIGLIKIPYNATIIAHEHMAVFAYFSIIEAALTLAIAYLLYISQYDKLKIYAILILLVAILMQIIYSFYCRRRYEEAYFRISLDKQLFKEMTFFAGWSFVGNTISMLNAHGVNMLINVFFSVKMNAARAVAIQVEGGLLQFVNSFTTAINPQITKSYALNELNELHLLICRGSKFSFFIMLIMAVPVIIESDILLNIWLKEVPLYSSTFLKLVVIYSLLTSLSNSMATGILATGKIKRYQTEMGLGSFFVFPLSWLAFYLGAPAYLTYVIAIVITTLLIFVRLKELKRLINFPLNIYLSRYASVMLLVSAMAFIIPLSVQYFMRPSIFRFLIITFLSVLWTMICIYMVGLEMNEKKFIIRKVKTLLFFGNQ